MLILPTKPHGSALSEPNGWNTCTDNIIFITPGPAPSFEKERRALGGGVTHMKIKLKKNEAILMSHKRIELESKVVVVPELCLCRRQQIIPDLCRCL